MDFLEKGILDRILRGAEIMGCMVMGGLISSYVKMTVPLKIVTSTRLLAFKTTIRCSDAEYLCRSLSPY